jgi:hypothetical protein
MMSVLQSTDEEDIMTCITSRTRRFAVAGLMALGVLTTAAPAHASTPVSVAVKNGGTDNVLVQVAGPIYFSVTAGCGVPNSSTVFAVCLPGGATMAFIANLPDPI